MGFIPAPALPYDGIGIVEDGNTASRAISKDQIVIWKGDNYYAKTDILQGASFVVNTNLTAIPDGVVNRLVESVKSVSDHIVQSTTLHPITLESVNNNFTGTKYFDEMNGLVYITAVFYNNAGVCAANTQYGFATLPTGYRPTDTTIIQGFTVDANNSTFGNADMTIATDGTIKIRTRSVNSSSALYWRFCASFVITHS